MRYFICVDEKLIETTEAEYHAWEELKGHEYKLEDYSIEINGDLYSIETMYVGSIDTYEEVLPFIMVTMVDRFQVTEEGIEAKPDIDEDYFATFQELKDNRQKKIAEFEALIRQS